MRYLLYLMTVAMITFTFSCSTQDRKNEAFTYIDPFIGTGGHGHTFPGATVPFGMVQLSPQTRLDGWDGCSGYHYSDSVIYGFAHTALNGTGVSDYGDILIMPVVGPAVFLNHEYCSPFKKSEENAQAGYYSVKLEKPQVFAELTATKRVGYHRYTFPQSNQSQLIIDLQHRDKVVESSIEFVNDSTIRGMRRSTNWAKDMVWYFYMEFSKPFSQKGIAVNDSLNSVATQASGTNIKAFIGFNTTENEIIEVKVGISAVDFRGAENNLKKELPNWNFEETKAAAQSEWNKEISKIDVRKGTEEQLKVFYTAMYHAMIQPNTFMDVDHRYRAIDRSIAIADDFTNYTVFSLWDTFRAWHPLMTIIEQNRTNDFIKTMLNMYEKGGLLPVWELAGNETYCMIGNHSIPVITDAWMKNIRGYDGEKALKAMLNSANQNHFGLDVYREMGYIPGDKEHESISKTLEYAYNDWCIAMMAQQLGHDSIYQEYIVRAQSYKNIFDTETGFMRPRLNGGWLQPFDPSVVDWHFTEANSWQYSFFVPQDIAGLADLHGGKAALANKLDQLFTTDIEVGGRDMKDISGLIGQYAHGNEPSHHMAYLYNYVDQPWKTQKYVRQIMDDFYNSNPDGLIGNEDCGQMSAWLIMSAMGFYPVCPGQPQYAIGTPWFPEMNIQLENGKSFRITADNLSKENIYVQSVTLNDKPHSLTTLQHSEIMAGGHLHFVMGKNPLTQYHSELESSPTSAIQESLILPVPFIMADDTRIKDKLKVSMGAIEAEAEIYYTLDGTEPKTNSNRYLQPFDIEHTTTIKAKAYKNSLGWSKTTEARFVKMDSRRTIELLISYHPNYHGGGADALIDGIRGSENWRLGGWQGYQGVDFEAIVDLGQEEQLHSLSAGFVQDIRSWIWMPKTVTFSVSTDGKKFKKLADLSHKISPEIEGIFKQDIGQKINEKARYVRVQATNFGTIPSWHLGSGGQAYIFIDEINIE